MRTAWPLVGAQQYFPNRASMWATAVSVSEEDPTPIKDFTCRTHIDREARFNITLRIIPIMW